MFQEGMSGALQGVARRFKEVSGVCWSSSREGDVTEALHRRFQGFRRVLGALQGSDGILVLYDFQWSPV